MTYGIFITRINTHRILHVKNQIFLTITPTQWTRVHFFTQETLDEFSFSLHIDSRSDNPTKYEGTFEIILNSEKRQIDVKGGEGEPYSEFPNWFLGPATKVSFKNIKIGNHVLKVRQVSGNSWGSLGIIPKSWKIDRVTHPIPPMNLTLLGGSEMSLDFFCIKPLKSLIIPYHIAMLMGDDEVLGSKTIHDYYHNLQIFIDGNKVEDITLKAKQRWRDLEKYPRWNLSRKQSLNVNVKLAPGIHTLQLVSKGGNQSIEVALWPLLVHNNIALCLPPHTKQIGETNKGTVEKFEKILRTYSTISVHKMSQLLGYPSELALEEWLLEVGQDYGIIIDNNTVILPKGAVSEKIDGLMQAYHEWEQQGKGKK